MRAQHLFTVALLALLGLAACPSSTPKVKAPPKSPPSPYAETANKIIDTTMANNGAWQKMVELCDGIGHRLSGSKALEKAIRWAQLTMEKEGHENVHTEPVMVPKWVRGQESAEIIEPRNYPLSMLGLGRSVGTSAEGLVAEVVVATDEASFEALGDKVKGKIVLFDNPMPEYSEEHGSGYGKTVRFRSRGPQMASEKGAVGVLVRSVTAHSLRTPHTGATRYADEIPKIPAAAISTEDAALIHRMIDGGQKVVVRLKMEARTEPDVESHNVIGELVGREKPEEVVVIGGHIDSWDVGQGAHDDAAGCVAPMEAITVLRRLGLRPRRTIRVVLWTNEENGLAGATEYAKKHASELANHVAAIEMDSGAFEPRGFGIDMEDDAQEAKAAEALRGLVPVLERLGPQKITTGWGGADVSRMRPAGVPTMGLTVEGSKYFDYHHTPADTLDKVDPEDLSKDVAALAVMAWILAEMPDRLGQ